MYILVFCVLLAIAFILVTLGLLHPEHTELSLVGFIFIFILSLILLNGSLEVVGGTTTNSTFTYTPSGNLTLLTSSTEEVENIYVPVSLEGNLAHIIGYWLAISAGIGFAGILISIRHSRGFK